MKTHKAIDSLNKISHKNKLAKNKRQRMKNNHSRQYPSRLVN